MLIDVGVKQARAVERRLVDGDQPLMRLRVRIEREVLRAGEIDDTPKDRQEANVRSYARSHEAVAYEHEGRLKRRMRNT